MPSSLLLIDKMFRYVGDLLKKLTMLIFGLTHSEIKWEKYMGNWKEPYKIPDGTDFKPLEMAIIGHKAYDYNHKLSIIDSKRKYGEPDLDTLGSLLCATCAEVEAIRNKLNFGYYANATLSNICFTNMDPEDLKNVQSIIFSRFTENVAEADFILASPGGSIEASLRLSEKVRERFSKLSFLLIGPTHSAATLLSFSGDEIIMQSDSNLSPINPRINGFDTYVGKQIYWEAKIYSWIAPWALKQLNEARILDNGVTMRTLKYIERLVYDAATFKLQNYLFKVHNLSFTEKIKTRMKIKKIVNFFTDFRKHWTHNMPFFSDRLLSIGLPIKKADSVLDEKLRKIDNICEEITTRQWHDGSNSFYVRKIYFSSNRWLILKHNLIASN
jgi:hypothetical protein